MMARKWRMDEIQIRALEQIQTEMEESIEDHNEEFE